MTLVAVCSLKGSPGVTTTALGLAARWLAGQQPVVVECDAAGGDLLARFRLRAAPGLVSLAAAARRGVEPGLVWQHAQLLRGGLRVVVGPAGADQARAALEQLAADRAAALRAAAGRAGTVVVADCGRIDPGSPVLPLVREADVLLLLAQARDDSLSHVATRVDAVGRWCRNPCFVLVGNGYPSGEVTTALGIEVMARLPEDAMGAAAFAGAARRRSAPARSALGRALATVAAQVNQRVAEAGRTQELDGSAASHSLPPGGRDTAAAAFVNGVPR